MKWTAEEKREAATWAAIGRDLHRDDSRVIERPGWWQVVTPSTKSSILNEVAFSQVDEANAEAAIDEAIDTYRAHGLPVKWFVGPWTRPADFGERLARRGFRSYETRAMSCDPSMRIEVGSEMRVESVTEANFEQYLEAFVGGWALGDEQLEPMRRNLLSAMRRKPRTAHFFLATIDGRSAGTTGLLLRDRFAYLVGAQVLDEFRGRGLYRALIEERFRFLRERDLTFAVTHAREATSAPMLEHLGFETLFRSKVYLLDP